jgi:hypothetical protein
MDLARYSWWIWLAVGLIPHGAMGEVRTTGTLISGGTLLGTVRWGGEAPEPVQLPVDRDRSLCGDGGEITFQPMTIGERTGVVGAFVLVTPIRNRTTTVTISVPENHEVRLEHCEIVPRSGVVRLGGSLKFFASDNTARDLLLVAPSGKESEVNLSGMLSRQSVKLGEEGVWIIRSPGRPWAWSQILVTKATASAVTEKRGDWSLTDLPADFYTVEVWHPSISMAPRKVRGLVSSYELGRPLQNRKSMQVRAGRTETIRTVLGP